MAGWEGGPITLPLLLPLPLLLRLARLRGVAGPPLRDADTEDPDTTVEEEEGGTEVEVEAEVEVEVVDRPDDTLDMLLRGSPLTVRGGGRATGPDLSDATPVDRPPIEPPPSAPRTRELTSRVL